MRRLEFGTMMLVAIVLLPAASAVAWGQSAAESAFHRGYYLQQHEKNYAGAIASFEKVVADPAAPAALKDDAKARIAQCREDLVVDDFAQLMPPKVLAYAEINRPGEHVGRLLTMMGLAATARPEGKGEAKRIPIEGPISFPTDFAISPALLAELGQFRGLAFALTNVNLMRGPEGVLIIHPGESNLIRGLLETSLQILEPVEPVEGFKTYHVEKQAYLCATHRLIVVSRTREGITDVVKRLHQPSAECLATQPGFQSFKADRKTAFFFVTVSGQRVLENFAPMLLVKEARIASGIVDLKSLQAITMLGRTTDRGVQMQVRLDLKEGHKSLVYGVIRTAPYTKRTLKYVPAGVSGLVLLGLNPAGPPPTAGTATPEASQYLALMDFGRELFSNVEELALFVAPDEGSSSPVPSVGVVFGVKDAAKSEALWTQLLSLAVMVGAPVDGLPQDVTVEGIPAREYRFRHVPPVVIMKLESGVLVAGTKSAVLAAAKAEQGGILSDPLFRPLLEGLSPTASKAVFVHVGRMTKIAEKHVGPREASDLAVAQSATKDLVVSVVSDEAPTRFSLKFETSGLPNVMEIVAKVAEMERTRGQARRRFESAARPPAAHGHWPAANGRRVVPATPKAPSKPQPSKPQPQRRTSDQALEAW